MQPFKWIVPCAGGPGERGGRSWAELLSSNSLTTERVVYHTPYGVCNELAIGSIIGKKVQIVSLYFFLSLCPSTQSSAAVLNPLTSTCQALYIFSVHSPFLPLTHTPAVFLSLPPPLFFIPLYIHLFVLGKLTPTSVEGERGLAQGAQGENISTPRANLAEDRGTAL